MGHSTSSIERDTVLVADTSVVINLNATGRAEEILEVLPHRLVTVDVVVRELSDGVKNGRNDGARLAALVAAGRIGVVTMADAGLGYFESLVVGAASETLDDGEAATIAFALETGAVALIDERKASRLCTGRFPGLARLCTVDILSHGAVQDALGPLRLAESVHRALVNARMQVPPHHLDWVLGLIGHRRAAECLSLPASARRQANAG